ncbi:hypothetical protein B5S27_g501 [[Candida] boidinii]|nr:hypothetical protein B5S27_g501 [[Candida] boidinii]
MAVISLEWSVRWNRLGWFLSAEPPLRPSAWGAWIPATAIHSSGDMKALSRCIVRDAPPDSEISLASLFGFLASHWCCLGASTFTGCVSDSTGDKNDPFQVRLLQCLLTP